MPSLILSWWKKIIYEPNDPRFWGSKKHKIVAIGGGTGLSILLRGLKDHFENISAIVTVTDDGKSSGIIRQEFDTLPPGDIRKCISALARDEELVSKLLEFRFEEEGKSFSGHTLGNIWITALTQYFGSFEKAIEATMEIFSTRGRIYPSTLDKISLVAEYSRGKKITGETKIAQAGNEIKKIYFDIEPKAYPKSVKAIEEADLIIFGPGSLFTSIIPNLLIDGIKKAIKKSSAKKIYIANCSTERGETEGLTIEQHIDSINKMTNAKLFDYTLVNNRIIKKSKKESALGEINNITTKLKKYNDVRLIHADIIDPKNPLRHDSAKLAKAIAKLL